MKKRIWIHSPITVALLAIIVLLAVQNYLLSGAQAYGHLVFQIFCVVAAVLIIALSQWTFGRYLKSMVAAAGKVLTSTQRDALDQYPFPVALVGERNDLVWCNRRFSGSVGATENFLGENIAEYLSGHTVTEIPEDGLDVEVSNKLYTVYCNRLPDDGAYRYLLYFIENTQFKTIAAEYKKTRPVAALIVFDNMDEISKLAKPGEMSQISADVEMKIVHWVNEIGGFMTRTSAGHYQIIWEAQHLERAIERKFDLLDAVRTIQLPGKVNVTLSIGVGGDGATLRDCADMAGQALDMALGRGGDQTVVKLGADYQFFGGVSKGIEKRSKVRARVVANALSTLFEGAEHIFVMGHRNSDLDCVGAAVGIFYLARARFGKEAHIVIDPASTVATPLLESFRAAGQSGLFLTPKQALSQIDERSVLVIVDTHSRDFLESREVYDACKQVAVIDHHRKMVNYIDRAVIFYHEPFASSASEMVTELIDYLTDGRMDPLQAEALLSGIMLDTKNFVLKTGARTFEAAAFLRKNGADPVEAKRLFANSFESYQEKYEFISSAELYHGMAIAVGTRSDGDFRVVAAQAADELLGISGVDASFVLFPFGNGVNVSARSFGRINVQLIMEKIGGGGHLTMAGAQLPDMTPQQARDRVVQAIDTFLADRAAPVEKPASP